LAVSLPDAEAAKNFAEQIIGAKFAGDLPQRLLRIP
jgi:hypothetical protein